jgi:hypothetical protein
MNYRHRRAPSTMQVTYEDTLESPNNEPASFQLPLKELNFKESNEKDFFTSVRKWVSNNDRQGMDEENAPEKVLVCEDIDAFSDAETEDPLDELNEMMKKIMDQRNGKRIVVDGIRKNIKMSLFSLVGKQVEDRVQVKASSNLKARHSRKAVKFQDF